MTKAKDTCDIFCFDPQKVNRIQNKIEEMETNLLAKVFKVLGDENRLKIALTLCMEEELCVCDVANIIGSSVATASHHLRTLKNIGLANVRREGKMVFYSFKNDYIKQILLSMSQNKGEAAEYVIN